MNSDMNDLPLLRSLLTLASVIEARDPYTGGHIWRVSRYARALAGKAGLNRDEILRVELGGLVHDLGKVGMSDAILGKTSRLTPEEFGVIKRHSELGRRLVADHPMAPLVIDSIFCHHERVDGQGYPRGIAGPELPMISRLISIADAFDAMTSERPYQKAMPPEKAYGIISEGRGKQFDAELGGTFVELGARGGLAHILRHCGEKRLMLTCPKCGPIIAPPAGAKDGDLLACPACSARFLAHTAGETFHLEHTGAGRPQAFEPDEDVIDEFIRGNS